MSVTTNLAPRGRRGGNNVLVYLVSLIVVAITVGPVLYGAMGGFRTNAQLAEKPTGLPDPWVTSNYASVLSGGSFWTYAINSTVIAVITTVVAVVFGVMAAYPLARYRFKGREALFMVFVLGLLFPAAVAVIPLFILVTRDLGMGNTWWGVALPQAAFALPLTVVILRPFLMALPRELEEAALIDGASHFQAFRKIVVPLAAPGVVTAGLLVFIFAWNEFLFAITLTSTPERRPVPAAIAFFTGSQQFEVPLGTISAAAIVVTVPLIALVLFFQKRIVAGLTAGAVKG